jgi:hypothetical protein
VAVAHVVVVRRHASWPLEALLVGLIVPALWWVHGRFLERRAVRAAILAVLVLKVAGSMLLTQQGLCARFSTPSTSSTSLMPGPYHTEVLTIPIDEPNGVLRSWDVRAGWRAASPSCTAVIDRPYTVASAFPAWFVNITDFASGGHRDLAMDVSGYARVDRPGRLSIDLDRDTTMTGTIGSERVSSQTGRPLPRSLTPVCIGSICIALPPAARPPRPDAGRPRSEGRGRDAADGCRTARA